MFSISPSLTSLVSKSVCPSGIECPFQGTFCVFPLHEPVKVAVVEAKRPLSTQTQPVIQQAQKKQRLGPSLAGSSSVPSAGLSATSVTTASATSATTTSTAAISRTLSYPPTSTSTSTSTSATLSSNQQRPSQPLPKRPNPVPPHQTFNPSSRPIIQASFHSKVDRAKRQKILDLFYAEFSRIYAPILPQSPSLAHKHAFDQESALLSKCNNPSTYSTMAVPILNRLKKRSPAKSVDDVGIDGVYVAPVPASSASLVVAGSLYEHVPAVEKFEALLMKSDDFERHQYPTLQSIFGGGAQSLLMDPTLSEVVQQKVQCNRCRQDYLPTHDLVPQDWTACTFHTSRPSLQPTNAAISGSTSKAKFYPCCQQDMTSPGCRVGPHVFKETAWKDLNARIPFIMLPEESEGRKKIVGVDCEMSYTTGGMEVTRVTIVDVLDGGRVVLDELVKPRFPVLDLNTEFSGITSLSSAKFTLPQLHMHLGTILSRATILIGHGLENDLIALRLIHDRVIDTCVLFPRAQPPAASNPQGTIWKHSLKMLVEKVLGRRIQALGGETLGHDSTEDARGAVELVLEYLKVQQKGGVISY